MNAGDVPFVINITFPCTASVCCRGKNKTASTPAELRRKRLEKRKKIMLIKFPQLTIHLYHLFAACPWCRHELKTKFTLKATRMNYNLILFIDIIVFLKYRYVNMHDRSYNLFQSRSKFHYLCFADIHPAPAPLQSVHADPPGPVFIQLLNLYFELL